MTNTLAVGLVFMVLFQRTEYTDGLVNLMLSWFGAGPVDFINGPHWAKMFVLCFYTIWVVLPFKILVLTSALASVSDEYYKAARVDGTSRTRNFFRITLPMISPMIVYLVITGFIGAFKAYSDAVALFGTDLNAAGMNTIVGYVYDMLYGDSGGYPSYASAAAIILFVIVLTINLHQPACHPQAVCGLKGGLPLESKANVEKKETAMRRKNGIITALTYLLLSVWAVVVLFPFYWMVLSSIKSYGAYNSEHTPVFFTLSPTLENYENAFTAVPLLGYLLNTLIFSLITTAAMVLVSTLAPMLLPGCGFEEKSGVRTVPFHDDDPHRAGGYYQLCHHHQHGSSQQLFGTDSSLYHLGLLHLSAQGKL